MNLWIRVVLWLVVLLAPGGVLLLPLLAADKLRRAAPKTSGPLALSLEGIRVGLGEDAVRPSPIGARSATSKALRYAGGADARRGGVTAPCSSFL